MDRYSRQAPNTREFRIYCHPGTNPPPDRTSAINWQERYHVVGFEEHVTLTSDPDGRPLRRYEVFLPAPGAAFRESVLPTPSLAEPVAYAHVGVSAAYGKPDVPDAPKWATGRWGNRPGNEGPVGAAVKIFRVLRTSPPAPVPAADAERVFATPADYHGRSYYTYRWRPEAHLKAHIYRALDDILFKTDWAQRPRRPPLAVSHAQFFPDASVEPRWNTAKREQVAAELNQLDDITDPAEATAYYRRLSNDALRVLAGLPGNERAFSQITVAPLDPDDPANANRIGLDNPTDFAVDPALRAYLGVLDGRAMNRYFYRAAYVDGAHNRGPLGLSSPPVYLPKVTPPKTPILAKALGGDREITLHWISNREPDLLEYRVFRADTEGAARDLRLMTHAATVTAEADPAARPPHVVWTDRPVPVRAERWYRVVAVDRSDPAGPRGGGGNLSPSSAALRARALALGPPPPCMWEEAAWRTRADRSAFVHLAWRVPEPSMTCVVERRDAPEETWFAVSPALWPSDPPLRFAFDDTGVVPGAAYEYRIALRDSLGRRHTDPNVPAPDPPGG